MATKTPAKKTTSKKPVAKKAPPVRTEYPRDARVKVTRPNGTVVPGRVTQCYLTPTGPFITVNIGTKQMPIEKDYRPAKVKGY